MQAPDTLNHPAAAQVALLYPGDRAMRDRSDPAESRFAPLFDAFTAAGIVASPAVYHDDFTDEVESQLRGVGVVLAWCNPIAERIGVRFQFIPKMAVFPRKPESRHEQG